MDKLNIESSSTGFKKKPVIIIVVGMAGNRRNLNWTVLNVCYMLHIWSLVEIWVMNTKLFEWT